MKYVGIGNEVWGCGGEMRAEYAVHLTRRYAYFLNAPEGQSLIKVAAGPTANLPGYKEFIDTVMRNARDLFGNIGFQALSLHYYTGPVADEEELSIAGDRNAPLVSRATGFSEDKWANYLRSAKAIEGAIEAVSSVMDKYDPEKKIALYVDEWGAFHQGEPDFNPIFQQSTLLDALTAALTLNIFQRHTDRVKMANIAQMVNVLQAMILTDNERMLLTPTYHVFDMYQVFRDASPFAVTVVGGDYIYDGHRLPAVDVSAAKGGDGKLYLALVNVDPHRAASIATNLQGKALGVTLTGPAIDTHNTFDAPNTIHPTPFAAGTSRAMVGFDLPARSVAVVTIE